MKKFLIIFFLLIVSIFLYGRYIEPNLLKVQEYEITNSNITNAFDNFKIVQFSDVLYRETTTTQDIKRIVKKINECNPDIIIFTGDLINKNYKISDEEKENLIKELTNLNPTLYKYAVIGDNDNENLDLYKSILDAANFKLLNNAQEYLFYKDINPIKLIGLTDLNNIDTLNTNEENITPIYTIAITHYPDNIETIKDNNYDLILTGHSLGGIINIPFYGAIIKKDNAQIYNDRYYKFNNTEVYINNGIGTEDFTFRLLNIPSISLYRLHKEK